MGAAVDLTTQPEPGQVPEVGIEPTWAKPTRF